MSRKYCAVVETSASSFSVINDDAGWMTGVDLGGHVGESATEELLHPTVSPLLAGVGVLQIRHHRSKFGPTVVDGVNRRWVFHVLTFVFDVDHPKVGDFISAIKRSSNSPTFFPVVCAESGSAVIAAHRQFWAPSRTRPKYPFINQRGEDGFGEASTHIDYPLDEATLGPGPVSDSLGSWYRMARVGGVLSPVGFDTPLSNSVYDVKKVVALLKDTAVDTPDSEISGLWRGTADDFWWSGPDVESFRTEEFYLSRGERGESGRYLLVLFDTHKSNESVILSDCPGGTLVLSPTATDSRILGSGAIRMSPGEFKYAWYVVEASTFSAKTKPGYASGVCSVIPFYREWTGEHIGRACAVAPPMLKHVPSWITVHVAMRPPVNETGVAPTNAMSDYDVAAPLNTGYWSESGPTYGFFLGMRNATRVRWDAGTEFGSYPEFKLGDRFDFPPETFNIFTGVDESHFFDNKPWSPILGNTGEPMPWISILMALLTFFLSGGTEKKNRTKALAFAALAGLGTYYVTHETDWGKANLGQFDGVPTPPSGSKPIVDDDGEEIPVGGGGVKPPVITTPGGTKPTGIWDTIVGWGAPGAAVVGAGVGAVAGSNLFPILLVAAGVYLVFIKD